MIISNPARHARRGNGPLMLVVAAAVALSGHSIRAAAQDPIDLSETPLFLGETVNPNVFMQLDDSGSMGRDSIDRSPGFDLADYQGAPQTNYDYDPNTPGNCFGNFCFDTRDWREEAPVGNALAFVADPAAREYEPWWDTAYGDSDFDDARNWPVDGARFNDDQTQDLAGSQYYEWIDDAGADNCPPSGPGDFTTSNVNNCGNDVADAWDSFRVVTINSSSVTIETYSFSPDATGANASSTSTTLTGGPHPELHGQTVAEVQQRYANYHTYFRTRRHVLASAVGETLRSFPNFRFGTDTIHERFFVEMPDASANAPYTSHNEDLFEEVKEELDASGGTPLRDAVDKAGEYYEGDLGGRDSPINHECQQNFTLAMTDGFWNGGHNNTGEVDGDGISNLLGDIGRHYYTTDLSPLPDAVQSTVPDPDDGDLQDQQHMVSYGVAFGVTGNLEDTDADGQPDNDTSGNLSPPFDVGSDWTNGSPAFSARTLDDLWHMAYNSTGEFLSANNPAELTQALNDALASIADRTGSAAAVATTSTAVSSDTAIFQALFDSGDWSGDLRRLPLVEQGDGTVEVSSTPDWNAAAELDAADWDTGREIITRNTSSGDAVPFRFADLSTAQQNALHDDPTTAAADNDGQGQQRLRFVRGDQSNELANGGTFRDRQSVFGDIINSEPVRVGAPNFTYPDSWPSGSPENGNPYSAFAAANETRTPVVYVGANDGMMHGFDATDTSTGGEEVLAYVPTPLYEKLPELTEQDYDHRFFVDGPMNYVDAFFEDGASAEWRSVLIGNLRTGGRGVYALDVTDPGDFDESNASELALWEFTPDDDPDVGHVTGAVPIVRLENGEWAAIFGNGFNSSGSEEAVLFIVDVEDGSLIRKISTGAGPSDDPRSGSDRINGLAAPTVIDSDNDSIVDAVYAGDLFGNLWKFDVSGNNPSSWGIATNGNKPLFEARSAGGEPQPITAAPAVGFHPEEPGFLVYTGTGKYLGQSDNTASGQTTQSIYAVWDKRNGSDVERSDLQEQTIDQEPVIDGTTTRIVSDNPVDWTSDRGWFLDLDEPGSGDNRGERVITRPVVQSERVLVSTLLPDSAPCGGGGDSFLMALATNNGGRFGDPIFDINNDGGFDTADTTGGKAPSAIKSKIGIISRAAVVFTSTRQTAIYGGTGSSDTGTSGLTPSGINPGRKAWQQLR